MEDKQRPVRPEPDKREQKREQNPQRDKGLSPERSSRTPDTEPPKEKRSDDL
jgi:hypothetical protein